jgi:DNA excision repair protein ERCC-4
MKDSVPHSKTVVLIDTREPWPHPWTQCWEAGVQVTRATLETGDVCLSGNGDVVIERKTASDFIACLGMGRERFENELRRATHLAAFAVVVEGTLEDCLLQRRGLHVNGVIGTLAAWQRRYRHTFLFAGTVDMAASFALRFLTQPLREARKLIRECAAVNVES